MNEIIKQPEDKGVTEYIPFGAQDKVKLSVSIVKNLIAVKTKSGKTCSDNDAIKFIAMCLARRLNPLEGDSFLIGYDGKDGPTFSLITAHQAFLKRAELNPEYDGMKSGIIVDRSGEMMDLEGDFFMAGDKVLGGWATVFFKNRKQPMHKRVRLERFKKPFGIWLDDAAGMICKCAEADALRSSFPTMLGGLYLKEEVAPERDAKISAPMFKTPAPTVEAETVTETKPDDSELLKTIRAAIKKEGLDEAKVLEFLVEIGSSAEDVESLEQVPQDVLALLVDQLSEIKERINENTN